ncbi:hypothetical protein ACT3TS_17450 [Specibacter sp. AOP5-B1-6]|uniref:hypothetical protein n=1 Tax=Specibacter sp. AOP5-B1-6 TaxID=3457653 RepID=UPI00402B9F81
MIHARGDKAIQVGKSLFRVFLVTSLGTVLIQVVLTAGDAFSTWVLESAGISSAGYKELGAAAVAVGPGLAIIAGIFGVIATLFQWGIMMVRAVVLPLLVAVWPLSAAASMVQGGEETFSKVTKWLIAFLLYKPVAAIIYAFAWKMKSGEDGVGGVVSGMLLLVLAVAALPALMKLVAPGTSALGGAAGGGMAMAAGAAVVSAGVAVGAAVMTGGASAGASAGAAGGGAATAGGGAATAGGGAATAGGGGEAMTGGGASASTGGGGGAESMTGDGGTTAGGGAEAMTGPSGGDGQSGSNGGNGQSGSNGGDGPSGATPSSGASGAAGSSPEAGGDGAPGSTGGNSAGGSSGGSSGLQAGAESIGGSVADGGKDSDGTDVIGE